MVQEENSKGSVSSNVKDPEEYFRSEEMFHFWFVSVVLIFNISAFRNINDEFRVVLFFRNVLVPQIQTCEFPSVRANTLFMYCYFYCEKRCLM